MRTPLRAPARGAVIVEFALVVMILLVLVFGILDLGRALWTWNSAVDAVRRGARTASIVGIDESAAVIGAMQDIFPALDTSRVTIQYSPDGQFPGAACVRGTCRFVRVAITGSTFQPVMFFLPAEMVMPGFSATYPVEALGAR